MHVFLSIFGRRLNNWFYELRKSNCRDLRGERKGPTPICYIHYLFFRPIIQQQPVNMFLRAFTHTSYQTQKIEIWYCKRLWPTITKRMPTPIFMFLKNPCESGKLGNPFFRLTRIWKLMEYLCLNKHERRNVPRHNFRSNGNFNFPGSLTRA